MVNDEAPIPISLDPLAPVDIAYAPIRRRAKKKKTWVPIADGTPIF